MNTITVICNEPHVFRDGVCLACERDAAVVIAQRAEHRANQAESRRDQLRVLVKDLRDALVWCGGSGDFAPGGQAREGWLKVAALMQPIEAESDA